MVILLLLGGGLTWYGRRVTSQQVTDEERQLRTWVLVKTMLRWSPDRLLPVLGGLALQASGLLILFTVILP